MKHLELFSGIGGFRRAMDLLTIDKIMNFESIGYSEIDTNAIKTYTANYNPKDTEIALGDIVEFTSDMNNIEGLPHFALLTGGFPCQPFSISGNKQGFDDKNGKLFFEINRAYGDATKQLLCNQGYKNIHIQKDLSGNDRFVYAER